MGLEQKLSQKSQNCGSRIILTVGSALLDDGVEEGAGGYHLFGVNHVLNLFHNKLQLDFGQFGTLVQFVALGSGQNVQTLEERKIVVFHLVMMLQHGLDTFDHISCTENI